jgi:multidrug resistance efflux pump
MISLLLASYALITWLLFIRWRLLPWKIYTIIPVVTFPVVAIVVMVLLLNVFAPTSSDVRVTRYEVPIVPQVKGRVVEVAVKTNQRVKKGDLLFKVDPTQYEYVLAGLRPKIKLAKKRVAEFSALLESGAGNRFDLEKARADLEELKAQFDNASWELAQTMVVAPSDGTVINVQLRPGVMVTSIPMRAVMSFVEDEPQVYMLFHQNELHQVVPGNEAEFYIPTQPGKIFKATVDSVIWAQAQGQVDANGNLPNTGVIPAVPNRFPVKLIMHQRHESELIAAGAIGNGAIYTEHLKPLHLIRKTMVRVSSKLYYIIPKG